MLWESSEVAFEDPGGLCHCPVWILGFLSATEQLWLCVPAEAPMWNLPGQSHPELCPFSPQGNWDTSGSELSEGELEKQRRTLLEQLDEDQ